MCVACLTLHNDIVHVTLSVNLQCHLDAMNMPRVWPVLASWALVLVLTRWLLLGSSSVGSTSATPAFASYQSMVDVRAPDGAHAAMADALRDLEALAQRSLYAQTLDTRSAELLTLFQRALQRESGVAGGGVAAMAQGDSQKVRPSDGFIHQQRHSQIPMMLPNNDLFCDELLNTFPVFFGGDVPVAAVELWCRRGLIAESEGDHLPPGVEDAHIVQFTLLQLYRRLYLASQFQDRLTRYRELFHPMIEAMEKRHDRMLYNYI